MPEITTYEQQRLAETMYRKMDAIHDAYDVCEGTMSEEARDSMLDSCYMEYITLIELAAL